MNTDRNDGGEQQRTGEQLCSVDVVAGQVATFRRDEKGNIIFDFEKPDFGKTDLERTLRGMAGRHFEEKVIFDRI